MWILEHQEPDEERIHEKNLEMDKRKDTRKSQEKDGRMVSYEEVYFRRIRKGDEKEKKEGRGMNTSRYKEDVDSSGEWKHGRKRKDGGRLMGGCGEQ